MRKQPVTEEKHVMIVNLTKIKINTIKEGKLGAFKEAAFGDQKPALRLPQALPKSKES